MPKISKWQWRVGFWLAVLFGLLNAGVGGLTGNWKTFVGVLCTSLMTQLGSYLMKSPLEDVDDGSDTNPTLTYPPKDLPPMTGGSNNKQP